MRIPSRRRQRVAVQGHGSMSFSGRVSPHGSLSLTRFEARSPRDGDTRTHQSSCGKTTLRIRPPLSLACPLRARSHGHQRSITVNPVIYRQVSAGRHFPGQDHDPYPMSSKLGLSDAAFSPTGHARWGEGYPAARLAGSGGAPPVAINAFDQASNCLMWLSRCEPTASMIDCCITSV